MMSRKTNIVLFIICGTVFNIIVTMASFLAILILYSKLLYSRLPKNGAYWILPAGFLISIVISFLIYRSAMKIFKKKVDMEKYFEPGLKSPPRKH
jgi:Na+-driven multidrug efflux pump